MIIKRNVPLYTKDMSPLLFSKFDIYSVLEAQRAAVKKALAGAPESLSSQSDDEVVAKFTQEFKITIPVLDEGRISASEKEVD